MGKLDGKGIVPCDLNMISFTKAHASCALPLILPQSDSNRTEESHVIIK